MSARMCAAAAFASLIVGGCEKHDPHNFYGSQALQAMVGQKVVSVDPNYDNTLTIRFENGSVFQVQGSRGMQEPVFQPAR